MLLLTLPIITLALGAYAQNSSCYSPIEWKPCSDDTQAECGSYQVPLDYAHPEVGNATLAVGRIKTSKQPRLGTLFANPGGPGASGVGDIILGGIGQKIANITNGQYDIVSWDPRGVNQTTPRISCGFSSDDELTQFWNNSRAGVAIEARGNFTDQRDLDDLQAEINQTETLLEKFGQKCMDEDGAFLKYMGTAAVVRDMVSLSDCLEGPGKPVNYWGFSYGTTIGNYFVNMFPKRVGRVIIDGVMDSITYATENSYRSFATEIGSVEDTFAGFTQGCAQGGPQGCPIAENNSTPASIAQFVRELIDTAYDLYKTGDSNLTSSALRLGIWSELYTPESWQTSLASQLAGLADAFANSTAENSTAGSATSQQIRSRALKPRQNANASDIIVNPFLPLVAITCVDSIDQDNVTTNEVVDELVRLTHEVSPMFGEGLSVMGAFYCHRFPARAVERFTGPFNHTLAKPIIVIGNEADPITPFANAEKIAHTLGSSAHLLKQNGLGHSSLAENSSCTRGVVRDYFLQGTLPSKGKVCEVDDKDLFPKDSAASAGTSGRRDV